MGWEHWDNASLRCTDSPHVLAHAACVARRAAALDGGGALDANVSALEFLGAYPIHGGNARNVKPHGR